MSSPCAGTERATWPVSSDPLPLNWEKVTGDTVILAATGMVPSLYNVFDPVWKRGDYYYSLSGTVQGPDTKARACRLPIAITGLGDMESSPLPDILPSGRRWRVSLLLAHR